MNAPVVDDSAVMRRILTGALSRAGVEAIDEAGDGAEGVEAVQGQDYDLVLMDWNMPNMEGIEAVRQMRGLGKSMPIIMVTTEAEKSRIIEALQAGATNYIIKPFDPATVASKLQEVMTKAGLA